MNFREFLNGRKLFHVVTHFACVKGVAWRDTNMAAELMLMSDEPLAADEEEMLIDSDDEEEIFIIAATSIFMRKL